jgi:hypothetical protein
MDAMMDDTAFSNRRIYGLYSALVGGSTPLACLYVIITHVRYFTYVRDFFAARTNSLSQYIVKNHTIE